MAHNNSSEANAALRIGPIGYRRLVAATALFTYVTILLGVSTKATGAGLACNANWPLCDGGLLNLFPASAPSFFEWFHRLVAGVTGLLILASTVGAWRGVDDRLVKAAATFGLVMLPVQVMLGRQTVLQYTGLILAAHYWVAMSIFGAFVVVAARAWDRRLSAYHVRRALTVALVLLPVQIAFSPQFVTSYTPPIQATHYGVMLLVFAAVLVSLVARRGDAENRIGRTLGLAFALIPVQILFSRYLITDHLPAVRIAHLAVTFAIFAALLSARVRLRRATR